MDRIDKYMGEQKAVQHSPHLESRIRAKLEEVKAAQQMAGSKKIPVWQPVVIAACFVVSVTLGITAGLNNNVFNKRESSGLMVNDSHIEKFSLYEDNE